MLDEYIVKYRLIHFYVPFTDPISHEERSMERMASHGQRLHTESGQNTETDIYNVPQSELDRLEPQGVFFSAGEYAAMEAGVSDALTVVESTDSLRGPRGDTGSTSRTGINPDVDATSAFGGAAGVHPLTFAEMMPWQLEEYLRSAQPTPEEILEAVRNEATPEAKQLLLNKFLQAEDVVTQGEPREELIQLAAAEGGYAAHGPGTGPEGIKGTAPESDDDAEEGDEGAAPPGGGGSEPDATDAARAYATENNVDLNDVTGTGADGRITKDDVEKHLEQQ